VTPHTEAVPAASERSTARAVDSPLVRGGLAIGAGIVAGNILGFVRVALTAYLLGTQHQADALAVAIGPLDTVNSLLTNSMVFAFVPMLTQRQGAERTAFFLELNRFFSRLFFLTTACIVAFAPWLVRALAPGLDPAYYPVAANILRIAAFSTTAAGAAAIHSALLYTDRRFLPSAFYQASLNICTIACALGMWKALGVYGFAIGYTAGAWLQFGIVYFAARSPLSLKGLSPSVSSWKELITRPGSFLLYAGLVALNITITRAYATHAGPGMAAALEYCMRCIGVPLAFLVMPVTSSLLPEIARLRSSGMLSQARRLIDRTVVLTALAAVAACLIGIAIRHPVIALLFERGSFTAESTLLVSAVFLGFVPSLIGWSLIEVMSRSLFAMDRIWLPLAASAVPVIVNLALTLAMHSQDPHFLGLGASVGLLAGFLVLFLAARAERRPWGSAQHNLS